jgi:hypothetical protein
MTLPAKQREHLPTSAFGIQKGANARSYPLDTAGRARNALARMQQSERKGGKPNTTPAERAEIKRNVARKYPSIKQSK